MTKYNKNDTNMIESRKTEERYVTSDPKRMLGRYLTQRLYRTWTEAFMDEDTGENTDVERKELLMKKGTLIDQDNLAKIRFYMAEGCIKEVEVSNQNRGAMEVQNDKFYPYMSQVQIGDKKMKLLLHARSVENAIVIIKDYVELNFSGLFDIKMVKEFDNCIVILDKMKGVKYSFEQDFCQGKISAEDFLQELSAQMDLEDKEEYVEKKWYKINSKILVTEKEGNEYENFYTFVVNSQSAERANMLINIYLKKKEDEEKMKALEKGTEYEEKEMIAAIEESAIISIGCYIPKEFSEVYKE